MQCGCVTLSWSFIRNCLINRMGTHDRTHQFTQSWPNRKSAPHLPKACVEKVWPDTTGEIPYIASGWLYVLSASVDVLAPHLAFYSSRFCLALLNYLKLQLRGSTYHFFCLSNVLIHPMGPTSASPFTQQPRNSAFLDQGFLNLSVHQNSLEGLFTQIGRLHPWNFWFSGSGEKLENVCF